ncbi:unnamed protein product [marine sediment metagenome]|uniref:Uncharacterized protein n=1 Tax=marine sediment metagenome TaxID=412755 RepID=X1H1U7_9ZZZZ
MTATTGSDDTCPVEYYFDETTGHTGGNDSGWVTNPVYIDTGLSASTVKFISPDKFPVGT